MYVRPRLKAGDEPTTFGVSGKLWRSAVLLYDRQTLSLWGQVNGRAVAGPSSGKELVEIPAELTTWSRWKDRHPETLVLVKPPLESSPYASYYNKAGFAGVPWMRHRDRRLPEKELVLGFQEGDDALALPVTVASERGLLQLEVGGRPLLVMTNSGADRLRVFDRRPAGESLDFKLGFPGDDVGSTAKADGSAPQLLDLQTGSVWNQQTGEALQGPLAGEYLERVATSPIYFGIWVKYYPETRLFEPGS